MRFTFWYRWLFAASAFFTLFGVILAFFGDTALFANYDRAAAIVFWGAERVPESVLVYKRFLYGLLGGTIAGRWLLVLFVTRFAFREKQPWAWYAIAGSVGLWFVIDSAISWQTGARFNVVFNLGPALAVALPLVFTRREFRGNGVR